MWGVKGDDTGLRCVALDKCWGSIGEVEIRSCRSALLGGEGEG